MYGFIFDIYFLQGLSLDKHKNKKVYRYFSVVVNLKNQINTPHTQINQTKMTLKITSGQSCRRGTKCDCKIDWLWIRSPLKEMEYLFKFIFPFLRSGVEAKRSVELPHSARNASRRRKVLLGGKWGTECLNTRFPLLTLLYAEYTVKLILFFKNTKNTKFQHKSKAKTRTTLKQILGKTTLAKVVTQTILRVTLI